MTSLREAAQAALEALENCGGLTARDARQRVASITALRAALAETHPRPLTEEAIETAHIEIWRNLPSDFDHTSSGWIEQGIRYAERAHGIKEKT